MVSTLRPIFVNEQFLPGTIIKININFDINMIIMTFILLYKRFMARNKSILTRGNCASGTLLNIQ